MKISLKNIVAVCAALWIVSCGTQEKAKTESHAAAGLLSQSVPDLITALDQGQITSEALVSGYLARIDALNNRGPELRAVLSLNPNALAEAKERDKERQAGKVRGALHGIPILVKDNIETKELPTTAGALALKDNDTGRDSPLIAGLRAQGAIILGKTNLSQWANFRSEDSMSGWSALGGQVKNPHVLDRNPCGSSSGSGAAMAASLAAATIGTETNGSIICPSNANGIVGFKPTVGLVSQQYIIPISHTQDTAGPMTKTVTGAALLMNAMAEGDQKADYLAGLKKEALMGVRVGVARYAVGGYQPVIDRFEAALKKLEQAGAILVEIDQAPTPPEGFLGTMEYDLLKYEFKADLNQYLASTDPVKVKTRTLADVIAFNQQHAKAELSLFNQSIFVASEAKGPLTDPAYLQAKALLKQASQQDGIDKLMKDHNVAVLVAPSGPLAGARDAVNGDVWPPFPGIGGMAAEAGYPHATVPMGSFRHMPVGLSFVAGKYQDAAVLAYAYAFEQATLWRVEPTYLKTAADDPMLLEKLRPLKVGVKP